MAANPDDLVEKFLSIGLDAKNTKTLVKNQAVAEKLSAIIDEAGVGGGCEKTVGNLLYTVAAKLVDTDFANANRSTLTSYIAQKKISSVPQLDAALKYFSEESALDLEKFEQDCGVGVEVSEEELRAGVLEIIEPHKAALLEQKWDAFSSKQGSMLQALREHSKIKWADGKARHAVFNAEIVNLIGERPKKEKGKKKKNKAPKKPVEKKAEVGFEVDGEEPQNLDRYLSGRMLPSFQNSKEIYEKHVERTNNVFYTRFPPEPNGFLHIGHAKAINFNFKLGKAKHGKTYLRFDDTNPLVEEDRYIKNIQENVRWMGFEPFKVTYSSEYFPQLYALAVQLIKSGDAYVCHETKAQIKACRDHRRETGEPLPNAYRDRSVEVNLELFERMRTGKYAAGEATLRMKGDWSSPNANMWDPIAYRIIHSPHPHVGDKWCIYPSYDFTHCIVDSLEDISASCCTLEFENRRESYFWLLDKLKLYKPVVWEYSRLNIENYALSKRRLIKLVTDKHVSDWDDPRMPTINGLRRRGVPAQAINNLCDRVGVTRSNNWISPLLLDRCTRELLDPVSTRGMIILDPIKVTLTNFDEGKVIDVESPNHPLKKELGTHKDALSRVVYLERSDFRLEDSKGFYGMAPNKEVRLKYAYNITCTKVKKDNKGNVTELECTVDFENKNKVKGILHWVSEPQPNVAPATVEVRLYELLFKSKVPGKSDDAAESKDEPAEAAQDGDLEDGADQDAEQEDLDESGKPTDAWLKDINPNSLKVVKAFAARSVVERASTWEKDPWDCAFQFERVGYFCKDADSTKDNLVFNRTLALRESTSKKTL